MLKRYLTLFFILLGFVGAVDAAQINHGQIFTISGSGFGSRYIYREIFDDCSKSSVSTLWNDATQTTYQTPASHGKNVSLPHNNITKYAVGNFASSNYNAWLSTYVTGIKYPTNFFLMVYRRVNPNWQFNLKGDGNNLKYFTVSAGNSWFNNPYWYQDQTGQKASLTSSWDNSFYSSGNLGNLNTAWSGTQGGSSDQANDPWYNWVKFEYRMGLGSSGQILKFLTNNKYYQNRTNQNTFNSSVAQGTFSTGAYVYSYGGPNQYIYQTDIALVVGSDAFKRVILTNHSTYKSATIVEYQPIVSWSNDAIKISGNIGAIKLGTAYLHVFLDESDTPIKTIPVTIGIANDDSLQQPSNIRIAD